jgi:hypothetical protein
LTLTHLCRFPVRADKAHPEAFLGTVNAGALRPKPKLSIRLPSRRLSMRPLRAKSLPGAGIFNLLCIHYALRPRVSSRLTLGGRTWPRKPWVYGDRDSHPVSRYSCPHSHWPALHGRSPSRFAAPVTLPYHPDPAHRIRIHSFGRRFDRQSFSARHRSMSQLLRTV